YLSKMCLLRMREATFAMLRAARARRCPVVVAGSDATDHPAPYLAAGAAAVIVGEGDATVGEAVDALASGRALAEVPGLCLAGGGGGGGGLAETDVCPRSSLVRRRRLRAAAGLDRRIRGGGAGTRRRVAVPVPVAGRPPPRAHGGGPAAGGLPHGVAGGGVGV